MLSFSITVPVLKILQYNENAASLCCSLKETAIICCYTAISQRDCYHLLLNHCAIVSNRLLLHYAIIYRC